ncbi:MAG TPA: choice-of-anchor D domain-containing protein, partial [Pirellulaceae bacterium]|nr:choice-of-anchor D domain-containing protein [Pirellulaceae bacterium]
AEVADGGTVDFGTTTVGTPRGRVITITNTGTGTLSLTPINANSLPAGFLLVSNIGSTSLAPGQSTSFTVRMTASAAGTFSGSISIGNNDSDESPYDLVLTGVVSGSQPQSQSEVRYIDNGSSGYSTAGTWYSSSSGRDGDANWTVNGSGSNVATWTFTGLAAGQYRVSATWPSASHYASDAPYSVYNGSQFLGTSRVSQKAAPSGLSDAGSQWKDLGNFTITGNTLVVKLSNDANGWVAADAIRIELIAAGSKYGHGALPGASPAQQLLASAALAEGQSTGLLQQATDAVFSTDPEDAWLSVQETALSRIGAQLASQLSSEQPELEILHQTEELLDELAASLSQSREDSLGGLGARLAAILDQDA